MIGGINPNNSLAYQGGNNGVSRERSDVARAPAATAEDNPALERRIEARRAAEDTRLERFRADDVPLNTARALSTFANVAAPAEAPEGVLTGIDIRV
jgi:hypothetical protein